MRVRQIDNALDLFEAYSRDRTPMTLTCIARELDIPKSSAFNIIETLMLRGYLYETHPRGGYYPTSRLADLSRSIAGAELLVHRLHPELEALATETGETVLLSTRDRSDIVYLAAIEPESAIRYAAHVGQRRPLNTTSSGKAILSSYDSAERASILATIQADDPALDIARFAQDLAACAERGWSEDHGETMPDVMGLGTPITTGRWRLGLAVAGPIYRIDPRREELLALLLKRRDRIMRQIA